MSMSNQTITRRDSLKLGIAGLAGLAVSPALLPMQAGPVRPNAEQLWRTGWSMFTGPNGNFSVSPSDTAVIEDLRDSRKKHTELLHLHWTMLHA